MLLLFAPVSIDRHGTQRNGRLKGDGHALVRPGQFFQCQTEGEVVAAHTAVLLGEWQTEKPHFTHLRHHRVRKRLGGVMVRGSGSHYRMRKLLNGFAQRFIFVG